MVLTPRFDDALAYAARLHAGQFRKGTKIPYISHLMIVAGYVLDHGGSEDQAIAALLHDAVEDAGGLATAAQIRERYDDDVADIVLACSDSHTDPKPPWRERKEAYLADLPNKPEAAWMVSNADKLHNARAILRDLRTEGPELWERFRGGREGTLWYYGELADRFRVLEPGPLADELDRVVSDIEELA